jgi:hypothetical protein
MSFFFRNVNCERIITLPSSRMKLMAMVLLTPTPTRRVAGTSQRLVSSSFPFRVAPSFFVVI